MANFNATDPNHIAFNKILKDSFSIADETRKKIYAYGIFDAASFKKFPIIAVRTIGKSVIASIKKDDVEK
jgi:hypothetical protein